MNPNSETFTYDAFAHTELPLVLSAVQGPVDSFPLAKEAKAALKAQAIAGGGLDDVLFNECPAFDDQEQQNVRREAKRGQEVLRIFSESAGELTAEEEVLEDYAEMEVWRAVLVEASRRASLATRGQSTDDISFCRAMIQESQTKLYPTPERRLALESLSMFTPHLKTISASESEGGKAFTDVIRQNYSFVEEAADVPVTALNTSLREGISEILHATFDKPFAELESEFGEITNDKIVVVTDALLLKLGYAQLDGEQRSGWSARDVSGSRTGFLSNARAKTIDVGDFTSPMTWRSYKKLMIHELWVHTQRAIEGEKRSSMLEVGTPGSAEAEEGLGMLAEEIWAGSTETLDRSHYRYVIGAYANGVLDGQKHGVDETFRFAADVKAVELAAKRIEKGQEVDVDAVKTNARRLVFEHVFRAFRGMPEGETMRKDLAYKADKVRMIEYLNSLSGSAEDIVAHLMQGKFDPLNPKHLRYVESLAGS